MEIYPEEIHRRIAFQGTGNMLRITVTENESEQRWVLQGRLTGSYVENLLLVGALIEIAGRLRAVPSILTALRASTKMESKFS